MVLLQQMVILFVYMMIGYVACKKEYFDQEFGKKLSWLVVNVANPMLAISAVVNNEEQIAKKDFYVTILLAICFYAFFFNSCADPAKTDWCTKVRHWCI